MNSSQKRSNSASNRKLIPEKFELAKFNIPGIENWNCDPTAKIIIQCLEQKIDALMYENHLLKRKIKTIISTTLYQTLVENYTYVRSTLPTLIS